MNDKQYELLYWGWNEDDPTVNVMLKATVVVPTETMDLLHSGRNVRFYRFIVNDGEEWFLASDCVLSITEVW